MFKKFTVFRSTTKKLWNKRVAPAQAIQFIDSNSSVSDQEVLQYVVINMEELFLCMLSLQLILSELIVKVKNELFGMYVKVNACKSKE